MEDSLIHVNWDTHREILCGNLGSLRERGVLTDILLACDGEFFPAHKLVLSLCSSYFNEAFQHTKGSNPMFFICGVKKSTLTILLDFIYNGKVTVSSDAVNDIVKLGKMLRIPELAQIDLLWESSKKQGQNSENQEFLPMKIQSSASKDHAPKKLKKSNKTYSDHESENERKAHKRKKSTVDEELSSESNNKQERPQPQPTAASGRSLTTDVFRDESMDTSSLSDYEFEGWDPSTLRTVKVIPNFQPKQLENEVAMARLYNCTKCEQKLATKETLFDHFTDEHFGFLNSHSCNICREIFRTETELQVHVKSHDNKREVGFVCSECSFHTLSCQTFEAHQENEHPDSATNDSVTPEPKVKRSRKTRKFSHGSETLDDVLQAISSDFQRLDSSSANNEYEIEDKSATTDASRGTPTTCLCCHLRFSSEDAYIQHKQTSCKLLECNFCLKVFIKDKRNELEEHKLTHQSSHKPYSCPYCRFESKHLSARTEHIKKHCSEKQYECSHCYFETKSSAVLQDHINTTHCDNPTN